MAAAPQPVELMVAMVEQVAGERVVRLAVPRAGGGHGLGTLFGAPAGLRVQDRVRVVKVGQRWELAS